MLHREDKLIKTVVVHNGTKPIRYFMFLFPDSPNYSSNLGEPLLLSPLIENEQIAEARHVITFLVSKLFQSFQLNCIYILETYHWSQKLISPIRSNLTPASSPSTEHPTLTCSSGTSPQKTGTPPPPLFCGCKEVPAPPPCTDCSRRMVHLSRMWTRLAAPSSGPTPTGGRPTTASSTSTTRSAPASPTRTASTRTPTWWRSQPRTCTHSYNSS